MTNKDITDIYMSVFIRDGFERAKRMLELLKFINKLNVDVIFNCMDWEKFDEEKKKYAKR